MYWMGNKADTELQEDMQSVYEGELASIKVALDPKARMGCSSTLYKEVMCKYVLFDTTISIDDYSAANCLWT